MCVLSGHANTDQISDDYSLHSWNSSILINRIFCSATIRFCLTYGLLDCKKLLLIRNLNDFSSIFEYILLTFSIFVQWHDLYNLLFYLTLFLSVEVSGEEEYAAEKSQA
jgi:hypothetical protein